jgi:predicted nucleic acid-binding protein
MYPQSLLDTDILSELFKKNPNVRGKTVEYLAEHKRLTISHITKYEVLKGKEG